jgi:hypothetical protein
VRRREPTGPDERDRLLPVAQPGLIWTWTRWPSGAARLLQLSNRRSSSAQVGDISVGEHAERGRGRLPGGRTGGSCGTYRCASGNGPDP